MIENFIDAVILLGTVFLVIQGNVRHSNAEVASGVTCFVVFAVVLFMTGKGRRKK